MKYATTLTAIEDQLAGIVLHHPVVIDRELISPELFMDPSLAAIVGAIIEVRNAGRKPEAPVILDTLSRHNKNDLSLRLAELQPYSPANAGYYADRLREKLRARNLQRVLSYALADLEHGEKTPIQITDELMTGATSAVHLTAEPLDQSLSALMPGYTDGMEERIQSRRNRSTIEITTGLRSIDVVMGPVHPGELLIVAARPGTGKTALSLQIARHNAKSQSLRTAIFSLEMLQPEIIDRLLAQEGCATLRQLREGRLSDEEATPVIESMGMLGSIPLAIFDGRHDLALLRERIRREKAVHGLRLAIVDYLGLLDLSQPGKAPRWERVSEASRALKVMALDLHVVLLLAVQLNREADGTEPTLGALRDSGALEQDADRVLLLHRIDDRKSQEQQYARVLVNLAKNRHGRTGKVELMFDGEHVRFLGGAV